MIRNAIEYSPRHVSGPTSEPVTIAEIRSSLQLDLEAPTDPAELARYNATNDDLMRKARAARREAEGILGKRVGEQTWDIVLDWWPCWNWRLPIEPLIEVVEIVWTDADGTEATIAPATYAYSAASNRLWLTSGSAWPDGEPAEFSGIRIRVKVGIVPLDDDASAWQAIKEAILFRVGTFYAIREDMTLGTTMQATKVGTFEALLGVERNIGV